MKFFVRHQEVTVLPQQGASCVQNDVDYAKKLVWIMDNIVPLQIVTNLNRKQLVPKHAGMYRGLKWTVKMTESVWSCTKRNGPIDLKWIVVLLNTNQTVLLDQSNLILLKVVHFGLDSKITPGRVECLVHWTVFL